MQRIAGRSAHKARQRNHSTAMVNWRNAADGRPAARPEGVPQAARLCVTALGKGATIPCVPCLDPNRLWGSAYGFIYVGASLC
jgi:hypothetical protein